MNKLLLSLVMVMGLSVPAAMAEEVSDASGLQEHHGMMHSAHIAKALNLSADDTAKLTETMRIFAEQRKPLFEQMKAAHQTIKSAADGDVQSQNQLDDAMAKVESLRGQLQAIHKAEFQAITKGMTPQNRAKVALIFSGHGHGMKDHRMGGWHHRGQGAPETVPAVQ